MMFFVITPALIIGAFAERMKFSAMVLYSFFWGLLVYCPLAHWVWGPKALFGADSPYWSLDYAGGLVVHASSGISALVCALMIGKRLGHGQEPMPPHNLTYTVIGTCLLWVGWFGFNAGSALASDTSAVNAFVVTHLCAATALLAWAGAEWLAHGKPSVLGACSGAVAGLVVITPASGFVTPMASILMGIAAGLVCYIACTKVKNIFGYDDALDVFGVHGVGGTLGAILTGVFASTNVVSSLPKDLLMHQLISLGVGYALAIVGTVVILGVIKGVIGLRVTPEQERQGLDLSQHNEEGYLFL
jgi:Amt family ammonium transporter